MNENKLTNEDIEAMAEAAAEARENGPDMLKIKEEVVVDENAPLLIDDESTDDSITVENIKDGFDVDEEEAIKMMDTLARANADKNYPVYKNLPASIQESIRKFAAENSIPFTKLNELARYIIKEMISDSKLDKAFNDIQEAVDEALNMPSISDLYSEHMRDIIENKIPETVEAIKDEEPEKAEMLLKVKEAFISAYTFSEAKEAYLNNSRIRKTVRRWETEYNDCIAKFKLKNENSEFKMTNPKKLFVVLFNVLIRDPLAAASIGMANNVPLEENYQKLIDMRYSEEDIKKFCILICKSCETKDPHYVIDAAYMYYLTKNITCLELTHEAKTEFATELINNICSTISFIREKEAEFYAANLDKSKSTKKSNNNKGRKS